MFRKNWIQISTALVIAILLMAQVGAAQASLRDVTPDRPLIFYQLTGLGSAINTDSNFWKQLEQAPFWEIVYAELEIQSRVKDIHLAIEPGISLISYIFGEDIVFVLPQFGQITEISPLLMLRLKKADDGLGEIIASAVKIGLANAAQTTAQYGGYTIATIPLPEPAPFGISCALLDDVLAVGLGDTTLRKVIDLMNGSEGATAITKDAEFSSIMERLPVPDNSTTGDYSGVAHISLAEIVAFGSSMYPLIQGLLPGEANLILGQALKWLDLITSVTWAVSITDEGVVGQSYMALNPDATSQNFLKMLQVEPETLGSMAFTPEDAVGYSGANLIDLNLVWKMARNTLAGIPEIGEMVLGQLEGLEQGYGFSLEEDLFSWMGNEIGYVYTGNPSFSPQRMNGKLCLIIKVTDRDKAQQGLQRLTDVAVRLSEGQLAIQPRDYMGETIYETGELPIPMKPGYALVGDYLLLSPSTAYMEKLIDCAAGRANGLDANPRFQAVKDRWPEKVNSVEFADTHRLIEVMMEGIEAGIETFALASGVEDQNISQGVMLQILELVNLLKQAVGASIGFGVNDGVGIRASSFMQISDLETVVPISDPDNVRIARNLFIAGRYEEAEMLDRAMERYAQVLELDGDNWQALMGTAQILTEQDKTQEARLYWSRMGFVPEDAWYVIGPFENELGEGFDAQYPPEEDIEFDAEYEVAEGAVKVRWEKQTDGVDDGYVDFLEIFEPDQLTVAYAWTKVMAEEAGEVQLRTGSDDQMKVWLNGEEVISHELLRAAQPDQDVVTVTLNEGENQLLVKVCNEEMDWGFYLRFTEINGKPLSGLKFGE